MNCKQAEELLPLYAGRDLEEKRATLVTEHVRMCASCARVADQYHDSVQLTEQFAPPVFSEAVYEGIRQRVLREIETEATAPAWSQTIAGLFRPRLTWAIASVLLILVSMFAIYFIVNRRTEQLAHEQTEKVEPGIKERTNSAPQDKRSDIPRSVDTSHKQQQLASVPRSQRNRSRNPLADRMNTGAAKARDAISTASNVLPQPGSLPEPMAFPQRDSAASVKPLRMEIQTRDPNIRIIWFVQEETKPVIPGSKGI